MSTINDILKSISQLSTDDQNKIKLLFLSSTFVNTLSIKELACEERFANGIVCPLCGGTTVVRNGHRADGTQRFICRDCHKSFVSTTNSVISSTKKDLLVIYSLYDARSLYKKNSRVLRYSQKHGFLLASQNIRCSSEYGK